MDLNSELAVATMLDLVDQGGWLVSSAKCSPQEIAWARAERRFFVWPEDGAGYVVRPAASFPTSHQVSPTGPEGNTDG